MKTKWISITEAAKILNRSLNGVRLIAQQQNIPTRRVNRGLRTNCLELDKLTCQAVAFIIRPRRMAKQRDLTPRLEKKSGYMRIYMPEHPRAMSGGLIYEHWLIMEKHLGRHLTQNETVHHINRIRHDNRIENLHLYSSRSEHMKEAHASPMREILQNLNKK